MHLSHADNTRNIVGSPISGIDPQELIDTRQLCKDINTMILVKTKHALNLLICHASLT
jgi:sulfite reductase beta subunit-like hemoprotein